jgi:hypothetical protein
LAEQVATVKRRFVSSYSRDDQDGICEVDKVGSGWYDKFRIRWKHEIDNGVGINSSSDDDKKGGGTSN